MRGAVSQPVSDVGELLSPCRLCARSCGVDRRQGEVGYCGVGARSRCFGELVNFAEAPELVPSYTIFFAGCNLRCEFCVNLEWMTAPGGGEVLTAEHFRAQIRLQAGYGARSVNFWGGEPTCHLASIAEILTGFDCPLPVVFNSNFYFTAAARAPIASLTDIFLADFKFGNDGCALRLAQAQDYLAVVRENLLALAGRRAMIVRHLLLPGHFECCTVPVLDWLARELPDVRVSLPGSFVPRAVEVGMSRPAPPEGSPGSGTELSRAVTAEEVARALAYARAKGFAVDQW